jgi:hypothetical protein
MIIDKVHIRRLVAFKPEDNPPVRADRHSPIALEVSLQSAQSERRLVEVVDRACVLKSGEDEPDLIDHVSGEPAAIVLLEKALQAIMF